ncbi:MAG: NAD+ synthase [Proteobacteria bacterium]|nr:NAD+ synthase [Pseudomonadota bacterium]
MTEMCRIAVAQINTTVGDLDGNCKKMKNYVEMAVDMKADIAVFPELVITGYPPEDLLLKPKFVEDNVKVLDEFARSVHDIIAIAGFVNRIGEDLYNAAAIVYNGEIAGIYHKSLLPNYGVFDEKRYFQAGSEPLVFQYGGLIFGVNICEDIWHEEGPTRMQVLHGAQLILNINASPYHAGKIRQREEVVKTLARENHVPIIYANLVGGQDELVFDGQSLVVDEKGTIMARAEAFKEDLLVVDMLLAGGERRAESGEGVAAGFSLREVRKQNLIKLKTQNHALERLYRGSKLKTKERPPIPGRKAEPLLEPAAEVYEALKLGLHDYVVKNGFKRVAIGLSGGIDSSLVAVVAADALGKKNVAGVSMPSRYTSEASRVDAKGLADQLGIELLEVPIDGVYSAYQSSFNPLFKGLSEDTTEENIQARIRGNILMALSNKFGWLVLTTGNKSEMSVGYATLYGDMAGGFAVIKDVPKMLVYELSRYRNTINPVIPERVLTKAPTAELKPDQKDQDTLPPYDILDRILEAYIEGDKYGEAIISPSLQKETVERTLHMVDISEYKRRQSPPGIKITPKAFGKDRRMPITNKYRG